VSHRPLTRKSHSVATDPGLCVKACQVLLINYVKVNGKGVTAGQGRSIAKPADYSSFKTAELVTWLST